MRTDADAVGGKLIVRIAHAYGNRREAIETAAAAGVDYMEADVWYRAGDVWVRHEHRAAWLPLLFDRRPRGVDNVGPWALPLVRGYYVKLDVNPLRLAELLERTAARCALLLDLKGDYREGTARRYARAIGRVLSDAIDGQRVIVCGQTDVLDHVRAELPNVDVRYSIERPRQWEAFRRRLEADGQLRGVCMHRKFLTDGVALFLEEHNLEVFCWTVDDLEEARRLIVRGVDGIISNNIPMLEQLGRETSVRLPRIREGG